MLPEDGERRAALRESSDELLGLAGYAPFDTPVFEDTEVFARGVGQSTDIVQKEMFTFEDKGGRSLTLRPEGTAGACRAYVEHGMHKLAQPVKLRYWGPFFRHEAPQAGRYRQFNQIGAEALGSDDPSLDAELILLLAQLLAEAGVESRLRLSSLGNAATRAAYGDELRTYLRSREGELSDEVRARIDANPLRAFDSDHQGTRAVMAEAPLLVDRLDPEDAEHFAEVRAFLDDAGQEYDLDPTLVRGLDYYTRTVFEFDSPSLGAQSGVGGGGRYDGLVEQLGGPATPGVGWAAGIERILLAGKPPEKLDLPVAYVAVTEPEQRRTAFRIAEALRERGRPGPDGAGRALGEGPVQAGRPRRRHARGHRGRGDRGQAHGQRRAEGRGRHPGTAAGGGAVTDTFANRYRDTWCGLAAPGQVGSKLRVAGWVHRRRDHGGLIFIDLRDREGILQLVFRPDEFPDAHAAAHRLRSEHVISATGTLLEREAGAVNPDLPTGAVELNVEDFDLLATARDAAVPDRRGRPGVRGAAAAVPLPGPAQGAHGRRPSRCATAWCRAIRRHLEDRGFLDIETPVLTRSTPEGARDFLVPSRVAPGSVYALPQSPQIFKQLLMIGGFERYYQIARCFRDESSRADRLPEFTQLDVELAFVDEDDVIATHRPADARGAGPGRRPGARPDRADGLRRGAAALRQRPPGPPDPVRDRRPGRRCSRTPSSRCSAARCRRAAWCAGFAAPGQFTRKNFDELTERAQRFGAKGLVWGVRGARLAGARRWPSS